MGRMERAMPLEMLREAIRSGFDRDGQVTLAELRRGEWRRKLAERGRLRVVHRQQVVAVLVSPEFWETLRAFEAHVEELEDRLEELEIERLWGHRLGHERRPGRAVAGRLLRLLRQEGEVDQEQAFGYSSPS